MVGKVHRFIAWRYLFSHKEKTVINLISWISLTGIAVSTIALIVVMSVYNGIGMLTQTLFNVFDPELIVEPSQGKTFHTGDVPGYDSESRCLEIGGSGGKAGISLPVSQIVEENAWITLRQAEAIVTLRGVDERYGASCGLDTLVAEGEYMLSDGNAMPCLLLGWNVMVRLGVNSMTNVPLAVHIPKRGSAAIGLSMDQAFNNGYAYVAGAFRVQEEIDSKYVVADIDFVRGLMDYSDDEVTALTVTVGDREDLQKVKKALRRQMGDSFTVKDRYDQQPLYYKIFRSERLGVFLILSLIVLIATLNLIASLSLLIINKRKDIATLRAMGMEPSTIRRVFFTEGVMIAMVGLVSGLVIGFLICLLQQRFGIVKLGANSIVDAFPVAMRVVDFVATFVVVALLSSLVVAFTVRRTGNALGESTSL